MSVHGEDFKTIRDQLWKRHLDEAQSYSVRPSLLPEYQTEWLAFVYKRTEMINSLGGNPASYDFKSEFDCIWRKKFERILNKKWLQKDKLCRQFFYESDQPKAALYIVDKIYSEIQNPKSSLPVSLKRESSVDLSSKASRYRRSRSIPKGTHARDTYSHSRQKIRRSRSSDRSYCDSIRSSSDRKYLVGKKGKVSSASSYSSFSGSRSRSVSKKRKSQKRNRSRSRSVTKKRRSQKRKSCKSKLYYDDSSNSNSKHYRYKHKKHENFSRANQTKSPSISHQVPEKLRDSRSRSKSHSNSDCADSDISSFVQSSIKSKKYSADSSLPRSTSKTRSPRQKSKSHSKLYYNDSSNSNSNPYRYKHKKHEIFSRASLSKSPSISHHVPEKFRDSRSRSKSHSISDFADSDISSFVQSSIKSKKYSTDSSLPRSTSKTRSPRQNSKSHSSVSKHGSSFRSYLQVEVKSKSKSPYHETSLNNDAGFQKHKMDNFQPPQIIGHPYLQSLSAENKTLSEKYNFEIDLAKFQIRNFLETCARPATDTSKQITKLNKVTPNPVFNSNKQSEQDKTCSKVQFKKFMESFSSDIKQDTILGSTKTLEIEDNLKQSVNEAVALYMKTVANREEVSAGKDNAIPLSIEEKALLKSKITLNSDKNFDASLMGEKTNDVSVEIENIKGIIQKNNSYLLQVVRKSSTYQYENNSKASTLEVLVVSSDDERDVMKDNTEKYKLNEDLETLLKPYPEISHPLHESAATSVSSAAENNFFSLYKDALIFLENHNDLLGIYSSVIGPMLIDLLTTYNMELMLGHRIVLTLIVDKLRLDVFDKSVDNQKKLTLKEAIARLEEVLINFVTEAAEGDNFPSLLYGYDICELAEKTYKYDNNLTKKFIDCLLLNDGFESIDSEPFSILYEKVMTEKENFKRAAKPS